MDSASETVATIRPPEPVALVCGIIAGRPAWIDRAVDLLTEHLGPIDLVSDTFPFDFTDYYEAEMGPNLRRRFVAFRDLFDPGDLPRVKRLTNELERHVTGEVPRPINLDPGTLNTSQLVLASTKPFAHRVYLREGIYAEVTLQWRGGWQALPWTYPDYADGRYHPFLTAVREHFRRACRGPAARVCHGLSSTRADEEAPVEDNRWHPTVRGRRDKGSGAS